MSILMAFLHLIISSDFLPRAKTRLFQGRGGGTKEKGDIPKKRKGFFGNQQQPY